MIAYVTVLWQAAIVTSPYEASGTSNIGLVITECSTVTLGEERTKVAKEQSSTKFNFMKKVLMTISTPSTTSLASIVS